MLVQSMFYIFVQYAWATDFSYILKLCIDIYRPKLKLAYKDALFGMTKINYNPCLLIATFQNEYKSVYVVFFLMANSVE